MDPVCGVLQGIPSWSVLFINQHLTCSVLRTLSGFLTTVSTLLAMGPSLYGKPAKKNPKSEIEKEDFSVRFKALLHQLRKAGLSKAGVHYLVDGANPESENEPFIVSQPTTFSLAPNVYCTIRKQKAEKQWSWDEDKEGKNFRADVFSRDKSIEELEKLIMHWIKEYNQYILETGENTITLIGLKRKWFTEGFDFSNKFLAVIHKLKTLNLELPSIKQLTEIQLKEAPQYRYI